MKPVVAIVGCGRTGSALGVMLAQKGYPFSGLASRSLDSAKRLAARCGIGRYSDQASSLTRESDIILLTTPDDAIQQACDWLVQENGISAGAVVLHCSGAHPSTILASARTAGAAIGSMHPLQSFASTDVIGNPFLGIQMAIEGDDAACRKAKEIAIDLEAHPIAIGTETKPLYHAAAVVASNFLVVLMDMALHLNTAAGIPYEEGFAVLKPLITGTIHNIERIGPQAALTGPVVRSDLQTVKTHLQAMRVHAPEWLPLYRSLVQGTAELACKAGRIPVETRDRFLALAQENLPGG